PSLVEQDGALSVQDVEHVHEEVERDLPDLQRVAEVKVYLVGAGSSPFAAPGREEELVAPVRVRIAVARERRSGTEVGRKTDRELERRDVDARGLELVPPVVREGTAVRDPPEIAAVGEEVVVVVSGRDVRVGADVRERRILAVVISVELRVDVRGEPLPVVRQALRRVDLYAAVPAMGPRRGERPAVVEREDP